MYLLLQEANDATVNIVFVQKAVLHLLLNITPAQAEALLRLSWNHCINMEKIQPSWVAISFSIKVPQTTQKSQERKEGERRSSSERFWLSQFDSLKVSPLQPDSSISNTHTHTPPIQGDLYSQACQQFCRLNTIKLMLVYVEGIQSTYI